MENSASPPPSNTDRGHTLGKILIVLVVIVLLVNVPISYRGAGLIHSVPDATPVVIYNGIVLKGGGQVVYVLENHKLRPFSNPDTFNYFRHQYNLDVNIVADSLLTQFEAGQPIRRLVKCNTSPNVYALENGQKRLVEDLLPVVLSSRWDRLGRVTCSYLHDKPNGPPISNE